MTPDEISEFAEMLQDVCDADGGVGICRCPLGALLRSRGLWGVFGAYPSPGIVAKHSPELSTSASRSFISGYENRSSRSDWAQLGALFRQQYPARYEELGP